MSLVFFFSNKFCIKKFRLVIILWFGLIKLGNLLNFVIYLLEVFFFYKFDIKIMVFDGIILIRVLYVLWCL